MWRPHFSIPIWSFIDKSVKFYYKRMVTYKPCLFNETFGVI